MNPQLLQQLLEALGYANPGYLPSEEANARDRSLAYGFANSLLANQGPKLAALSTAIVPEADNPNYDYQGALERAYAAKNAIKQAAPGNFTAGEVAGNLVSPLNKIGAGSALGRIINAGGQTALNQYGEQGATSQDVQTAGLLGGGATAALESLPIAGKAIRSVQGVLQEGGLGLRGAAMKKAGSKVKDKTVLGEGYDFIKNLLAKGEGPDEAIKQAQKVFTSSGNRAGSYVEVADAKIKELVKKQTELASANIPVDFKPGKAFDSIFGKGLTNSKQKFKQAYESEALDLLTNPNLTAQDLLDFRREISNNYNQFAEKGQAQVYTALVDDINEAISKALPKEKATEFAKAGKDMQKLITFNDAVTLSAANRSPIAKSGDLAGAVTSGGGLSMAAYFAGVSNPLAATAIGSLGATPAVQGALGRALEKGMNVVDAIAEVTGPASRSLIKTQTPVAGQAPEQNMSMPQAPIQEQNGANLFEDLIGQSSQIPGQEPQQVTQPAGNLFEDLIASPETATPSPTNGDLPSQQSGLKQGVALSGADRFNGLANYYAALAQTESSMNPMAANSNSSAKGLFQFVDKTGQNLGLQDPFNPQQSLAAAQKLTEANRQQFGDNPELLYAGHYLGQPTLSAWQAGQPLEPQQQDWVNSFANQALPNFRRNMAATQQPNSDIMQQFMNLFG